jgi:hypothetical protein
MNSHAEIQRRLPAYSGGDLEPAEHHLVERHLADCPACRAELADIQTALGLIRNTPEVDPPPWMTTRIMARIKEQRIEKRSWLQRIFLPLHIKLPIEALALLMVCVSGYYISRSVQSDLRQPSQQQLQEAPVQLAPNPAQSPGLPHAKSDTTKPFTDNQPPYVIPPAAAPKPLLRQENLPPQTPPYTPGTYSPAIPVPLPPAYRDQFDKKSESMKAAPAAESGNRNLEATVEKKTKSINSVERTGGATATAPAGRIAGSPADLIVPQATIRLSVYDPSMAPSIIREAVFRSGGNITEDAGASGVRLKARIPAERLSELLERLQQAGRIMERSVKPPGEAQLLEVTIQW